MNYRDRGYLHTGDLTSVLPVVADNWSKLRGCDVYRLIDQFDYDYHKTAGQVILHVRPDLKNEVSEALADLEADAIG